MKLLLVLIVQTLSLNVYATGGIISGGPPLKLKANCENPGKNLIVSVSHSPLNGDMVFAGGTFGRLDNLLVTRSDLDGQPVAFTTDKFKLTIALAAEDVTARKSYKRPAWIELTEGDAIFSEPLTCIVFRD
jgi:hypothetical protein